MLSECIAHISCSFPIFLMMNSSASHNIHSYDFSDVRFPMEFMWWSCMILFTVKYHIYSKYFCRVIAGNLSSWYWWWVAPNCTIIRYVITRSMDSHTPGLNMVHTERSSAHRNIYSFVYDTNSGLTQAALINFDPPEQAPVYKHQ